MDYDIIENTVNRIISPKEEMVTKEMVTSGKRERHYFGVGRSALECIDISVRAAQTNVSDVKRILDLPCGHGRVLRYLKAAFPEAEITACDIMRDGVDF